MTEWIIQLVANGGYWGIAFLMVVENIFPPVPSELIMGLGGIAMAKGQMQLAPLLLAGSIGSTAGNYAWYLLGRRLGLAPLEPWVRRFGRWLTIDWVDVERAAAFLRRHGHWVVFGLRMSPFLRTMISLPAGLAEMGHVRFLTYTFAGTLGWNAVLVTGGYYLGLHFSDLLDQYLGTVVIASIILFVVFYLWRVATWRPRA